MKTNTNRIHNATITPWLLCAVITFAVGAFAPAAAQSSAQRFIQPSTGTHYWVSGGWQSDLYNGNRGQAYASFAFPKSQAITGYQWNGVFLDLGKLTPPHPSPAIGEGSWTVEIYADNGGSPGTRLHQEIYPASEVQRTQLGTVNAFHGFRDLPHYSFDLQFATPFTVGADTTYWVSVYMTRISDDYVFGWINGGPASPLGHLEQMSWAQVIKPGSPATGMVFRGYDGVERRLPWKRPAMSFMSQPVEADDLDRDGIDDEWERAHSLDPERDDSSEDPDLDGSSNFQEYARHSDPRNPDTDSDGLPDGVESATGHYVDRSDTGTSPIHWDSDRDGLGDALEDPALPSQDPARPGTNPNLRDTDRDGYADLLELAQGLDPLDPASAPAPIVLGSESAALLGDDLTDPEGDGITNGPSAASRQFAGRDAFNSTPVGSFTNLFDNLTGGAESSWRTSIPRGQDPANAQNGHRLLTVDVTFDRPFTLTHFTITSGGSSLRDPRIWELQGSNDGRTWHTIFHRENMDQSAWTGRYQVLRFDAGVHYPEPGAYSTLRFACVFSGDLSAAREMELSELEFFGPPFASNLTKVEMVENDSATLLEWTSVEDVTYAVERSENLNNWQTHAGGIRSAGALTSFTDDSLSGLQKRLFYRVRSED